MVSLRQIPQGIGKRDFVILHPEGEDIPPLFASKAVKHLFGLTDRKRRGLFRMKRTKPHIVLSASLELDKLADELNDVYRSFKLFFGSLVCIHKRCGQPLITSYFLSKAIFHLLSLARSALGFSSVDYSSATGEKKKIQELQLILSKKKFPLNKAVLKRSALLIVTCISSLVTNFYPWVIKIGSCVIRPQMRRIPPAPSFFNNKGSLFFRERDWQCNRPNKQEVKQHSWH